MCRFSGYEVRSTLVLYKNGVFRRERFWIAGWHPELTAYGHCKFILGSLGDRETEITCEGISPSQTFTVTEQTAEMAVA
jgi:hypothetical protein